MINKQIVFYQFDHYIDQMNETPPFYLIESFLSIVKSKNMREAAEFIGLSQPALSDHMKKFESYFPSPVFAFEGRKKILTDLGLELEKKLRGQTDQITKDILELNLLYSDPNFKRIRICGRNEILNRYVNQLKFAGTLEFLSAPGSETTQSIIDRDCELAITNHLEKADNLIRKFLFKDSFYVIFPSHWKIKADEISYELFESLLKHDYIAYTPNDTFLEQTLNHFKITARPKIKKIVSQWDQISIMVSEKKGWSLCPEYYIPKHSCTHFKIPNAIIPETKFYALFRSEMRSQAWFMQLIEQLVSLSQSFF